ncbi:MAG: hypothetical protein JSR58_05250 [Verrucomicrobia bacterium]|nr:hypothetical protein [Verrucomicrobiota bacterium]
MNRTRRLTLLSATVLLSQGFAADVTNQDLQSLRDWFNSKRLVTVKELGGQLSISGDVHAELQSTTETKNGERQRGRGSPLTSPNGTWDVEFNLNIDYRTERSWVAGRMRFDNDAGVVTDHVSKGTFGKIKVDRAYFGYRFVDHDQHTADAEIGRRGMSYIFDSKLQFASNFDGVNVKDSYAFETVGDFYYQLGAFIIDERVSRAGYIGETGLLNIAHTGFYAKYSLVDWNTKHNPEKTPHQFDFIISQVLLGYKFIPVILDRPIELYIAGIYNHRARKLEVSDHKLANAAGYTGFKIGQTKIAGDWSFETCYQVVQAQSMPSFDNNGIGMGGSVNHTFYYKKGKDKKGKESLVPTTRKNAEGNVNYQGFFLNLQYLLTNNINIFQQWQQSVTLDDDIGPFRRFKQYEIDFIYLF